MEMKGVKSSNLNAVGYDEDNKVLAVLFNDGNLYEYSDVPKETYEAMINAGSVGSYFHKNVRTSFNFKKM